MAKLIKKNNKWVCSKCKEVVEEWVEDVSIVSFRFSFDKKGNLEEVDRDYCGEVEEVLCGHCGETLKESPSEVYGKVRQNCVEEK